MEFRNTNNDVCISRISDLGFSTFEFRKIRKIFLTRASLKILGNASLKIHSAFDKYPRNPTYPTMDYWLEQLLIFYFTLI